MTYQQKLHETAEKMARAYIADFDSRAMCEELIESMMPLARIAVDMQAEGFDMGFNFWLDCKELRDKKKQDLGLIKPTENE